MPTTISSLPPELLGHIFDLGAVSLSISDSVEQPRMDPAAVQERFAFLRSMALVCRDWTSLAQALLALEVQLSSERAAKGFMSWIADKEEITRKLALLNGVKSQTATAILRASKGLRELVLRDLTSLHLHHDSLKPTFDAPLQPNFQLQHLTLNYGPSIPTSFLSAALQPTLTSLHLSLPSEPTLTRSQDDRKIANHLVHHLCAIGPSLLSLTVLTRFDQSRFLAPFFQRCDHLHHFGRTLHTIERDLQLLPALLDSFSILIDPLFDPHGAEWFLIGLAKLPSTATSKLRQLQILIPRGHKYEKELMSSFTKPRGPGDVGWVLQPLGVHRPTKFWTLCDERDIELVVRIVD